MEYRTLGNSDIQVSPVALGCWPIAGMTSPGATDENSIATIRACFDLGINHIDTAYMYGASGESERLIARALGNRRNEMVIASKGGLHWDAQGRRVPDARPATLRREREASLRRLETDHVEVYYLHDFDPTTPLAESAGELKRLMDEGKARAIGVSNLTLAQIKEFVVHCPIVAYQPLYNMLQRQIEADVLPWCREHDIAVLPYWVLYKGLLAGRLRREDVMPQGDSRHKYRMFHGDQWRKNHDFIDRLRLVAESSGHSVAQLVVNWTIHQPGVTAALCGAKRPEQIRETAGAAGWRLTPDELAQIEAAIAARGEPDTSEIPQ
ncbi:MAG: aldo/keto reductase [Pirellulales bacterium]|nr:aldo/keto reductase [Pirellulales bacterium]